MSAIAELSEERVVEGIYAVARKQRLRTKGGAPYLALELVDPSGRIDARVWHDVELLDARFAEGDAVRVLGRVEKFRNRLQVDVRTLEAAPEADPAEFAPTLRRDADELDGFLEFLAGEISHEGLAGIVTRFFSDDVLRASLRRLPASESHHSYAGGLLEHTVGVATICRETAQLHPETAFRSAARSGTPARRRPCGRADLGPDVQANRRRPSARARPPRFAHGRGAE